MNEISNIGDIELVTINNTLDSEQVISSVVNALNGWKLYNTDEDGGCKGTCIFVELDKPDSDDCVGFNLYWPDYSKKIYATIYEDDVIDYPEEVKKIVEVLKSFGFKEEGE